MRLTLIKEEQKRPCYYRRGFHDAVTVRSSPSQLDENKVTVLLSRFGSEYQYKYSLVMRENANINTYEILQNQIQMFLITQIDCTCQNYISRSSIPGGFMKNILFFGCKNTIQIL